MNDPFLTIWFSPRNTIRRILDSDPGRSVFFITLMAGATTLLMTGLPEYAKSYKLLPFELSIKIVVAVFIVVGALLFWIGLFFWGWFYRWVGSWFGGKGNTVQVRSAVAWSHAPTLFKFFLWIIFFHLSAGRFMWGDGKGGVPSDLMLHTTIFMIVSVLFFFWQGLILIKTVSEAHQFSAWKGLLTFIISQVIVRGILLVPIAVLALLGAIAIPNLIKARENAMARIPTGAEITEGFGSFTPSRSRSDKTSQVFGQVQNKMQDLMAGVSTADRGMVQTLRDLANVLEAYRIGDQYSEYPFDLDQLLEEDYIARQVDTEVVGGSAGGYQFIYTRMAPDQYELIAIPEDEASKMKSFYLDDTGIIRFSVDGEAGPDSEAIQENFKEM